MQFNIEEFMQQVNEMQLEDAEPGQGAPAEDWFMTQPFSPLRVRALKLFDLSSLALKNGSSVDELEAGVQVLMTMMEPSYLEGRTDASDNMRRLLFAASIAVANANGKISDKEIAAFKKFFGERTFSDELNLEKLAGDLPERIKQTKELTTIAQRMQVIRDLCTVAKADNNQSAKELKVIKSIAQDLEVPEHFSYTGNVHRTGT